MFVKSIELTGKFRTQIKLLLFIIINSILCASRKKGDDLGDSDDDFQPRKNSAEENKPAAKCTHDDDPDDGLCTRQKLEVHSEAVLSSSKGSDHNDIHRSCRDM